MTDLTPAATASAALSLAASCLIALVRKGVLPKDEALRLLDDLASAKEAKSVLHVNEDESDAAQILLLLRGKIEQA